MLRPFNQCGVPGTTEGSPGAAAGRNHTSRPLLSRRGRGHRHAMAPEDVHHLRAVGRAAGGGSDYFGSFAEVRGAHYRRGYDGELFHILAAEVIEAGHGRAVDQGRQASGEDDAAKLSSLSVERSAVLGERDRLQFGEPLAAAGATEEDREVVADEFAAAVGEDGWTVGEARAVPLAAVGQEPFDAALVWKHAAADGGFAAASWVGAAGRRNQSG